MTLKIRLRQQGRKNGRVYRLVVADIRSPRDGKYVETLGWYNPKGSEGKENQVNAERADYWLNQGAQPSEKALSLLRRTVPEAVTKWMQAKQEKRQKIRLKNKARGKKAPSA